MSRYNILKRRNSTMLNLTPMPILGLITIKMKKRRRRNCLPHYMMKAMNLKNQRSPTNSSLTKSSKLTFRSRLLNLSSWSRNSRLMFSILLGRRCCLK